MILKIYTSGSLSELLSQPKIKNLSGDRRSFSRGFLCRGYYHTTASNAHVRRRFCIIPPHSKRINIFIATEESAKKKTNT